MSRQSRYSLALILLLLLLAGGVRPGLAQGSDPTDDEVNAIARQLYCPVCENVPLDACGTAACEQWRGIIRDKLAEGWTEEQIKAYFVEQYGDRVLAEPPRRGFNWLVYLVPLLALLTGVLLLTLAFRKWRVPEADRGIEIQPRERGPNLAGTDEYINKVEKELRSRDRGSK